MAKVVIPYPLRKHTDKKREIGVAGGSIKAIMDSMLNQFPGLKDALAPLDFIAIFLNGERIKGNPAEWANITVTDTDEIAIILPIAGGRLNQITNESKDGRYIICE